MRTLVFLLFASAFIGCGDNDKRVDPDAPRCGNGIVDTGEICDGHNLHGNACDTIAGGFGSGALACNATCDGWDTTGCMLAPVCGDGVIAGSEMCDGSDIGGATCAAFGYASGSVSCGASCQLDFSGCVAAPMDWTCAPATYGTGDGCDCGCGVIDADCPDGFGSSCTTCNGTGSCSTTACPGDIMPNDNTRCVAHAPPGWRCLEDYYFDADCDCGCGVPDPACADATVASCTWCDDSGSCSTACPGNVDPSNNATCTMPAQWTCDASTYGTGDGCDCGCGSIDPDCTAALLDACTTCDAAGSCGNGACPANINPGDITTCAP